MEEEQKRVVRDVFGESSESEEEGDDAEDQPAPAKLDAGDPSEIGDYIWQQIREIKGLWLCRDFLSAEQQHSLLRSIENEGWFGDGIHNQANRFGDLPAWAIKLSSSIRQAVYFGRSVSKCDDWESWDLNDEEPCPLPSDLLWREPLFDQLIAHVYQPCEGICAHVDLMRFEDGIAIVSLESTCVMHFSQVDGYTFQDARKEKDSTSSKIPVLLNPGSLILMHGEARYSWKHEIDREPGSQVWDGQQLCQQKRTSVTLRKLCPEE